METVSEMSEERANIIGEHLGQPPWHNADTSRKTFSKDTRFGGR